jgi:putative transposase
MGQTNDTRTARHCGFLLHAHLVFVTKHRHLVFTDAHLSRLVNSLRLWSSSYLTDILGASPLNVLRAYIE